MSAFYDAQLERLRRDLVVLPDKPEENPENTLKALCLLAQAQPVSVERAAAASIAPLSADQERLLEGLVATRLGGVPLGHLTGRQQYMGIEMLVSPGALIPRKETEILANAVGEVAGAPIDAAGPSATLIDICTGVGNVAIYCARRFPSARVFASDLSGEAVAAARANALFCGMPSIDFRVGDLLDPFDDAGLRGGVDLISCNPPYISHGKLSSMAPEIANHEPRAAFDGGPFGIAIVSRLIHESPAFLRPGGWLVFEIGLGQGGPLLKRIERLTHYHPAKVFPDARGQIRALALQKAG